MRANTPEQVHAVLAEAFSKGDLDAFVELHEDGAVTIVPPDGQQASGCEQIRDALAPVFALRPTVTNEVVSKLENHGLALTQARWRLLATSPDDERVEMRGEAAVVSRRAPDGSWRIVPEHPIGPV